MNNVTLIEHTPNPERTVALAARLCYSPSSINDLREKLADSDIESFLEKIMSLGHHSVLEHASFTFGIEGISRVTTHQLVRHRIASFSQQSQRYVSHKEEFTSIMPDTIAENPEARQIFAFMSETVHKAYAQLVEMGIPAEDARYILPNAAETKIIMTMNARELLHFFALRCCQRAQWEIRQMSVEMLRLVKQVAPVIFRDAGPGCVVGPCPEGRFCCGQTQEVREFYKNLE
ncbi:MAG: FAD-dependent thymidylate synthase [Geobacteraceae bacterium GWC2_55_20]|nr:FAD-dependent thymidylate synthase [Deltaproteobacteria bacterium]OGU05734.1 MAG: FAD-dependent thymidylate synthase [Geobacteraceae bacterium GWC2_55_20]OGU22046.1 MAG: FAD-dependent thymidylate synthase [Geobacteraceae bacterium GWF2_54_21]HCE66834.1 FAD-dependent thymidylate synthase [Geobacter sp.]